MKPALTHLKKIVACTTYGRPHWMAFVMGDPPRKVIKRYLRVLTGGKATVNADANLRAGPDTGCKVVGHLFSGEMVDLAAVSEDGL